MHRPVFLELHMISSMDDKTMNSFWGFIHDRVENIPHELIEKQNMIIVVYISLKRLEEELEKW